jgi:hypothetical protein
MLSMGATEYPVKPRVRARGKPLSFTELKEAVSRILRNKE